MSNDFWDDFWHDFWEGWAQLLVLDPEPEPIEFRKFEPQDPSVDALNIAADFKAVFERLDQLKQPG